MDETQWLTSNDPVAMLMHLRGRVTERKLRLFVCACLRRHWDRLADPRSRRAVEIAELYADGLASEVDRFDAWDDASAAIDLSPLTGAAVLAIEPETEYSAERVSLEVVRAVVKAVAFGMDTYRAEHAALCALLRCLFGPRPFATPPRVPDAIRAWDDRTIGRLARAISDEQAFDHLGVLADALEDAGCCDRVILDHLRGPGPHARGCFALDSCLLP
jgi:hypothetical protein